MKVSLFLFIMLYSLSGYSKSELIVKKSPYGVKETIDRVEAILNKKGIGIMNRFDHQKNAKKVQLEMGETEVIFFGNPKLGTFLMKENPLVAIDLPMKMMAYKDEKGQVWLTYSDPQHLVKEYNLKSVDKQIEVMSKALLGISTAATSKQADKKN